MGDEEGADGSDVGAEGVAGHPSVFEVLHIALKKEELKKMEEKNLRAYLDWRNFALCSGRKILLLWRLLDRGGNNIFFKNQKKNSTGI